MPEQQAPRKEAPRPQETDAPILGTETPAAEGGKARARPGQYLSFFLSGAEYAAGILQVREIIEYDTLTRVPLTPPWMRGVLNLRGGVVPVVDLAVKFGLPETEATKLTCVVIVEIELEEERTTMGVVVDAVSQVLDLTEEQIEPAPAFGTRVRNDFLLGMATVGEDFILILDISRILASDDLSATSSTETEASREGTAGLDAEPSHIDAQAAAARTEAELQAHLQA